MSKRRVPPFVGLVFLMGVALVPVVVAQEVLTNELVVRMVRAKLADSVIINKIQISKSAFDLTTDALIALKQAGVSEKVQEAMLQAQQKYVQVPPQPPPSPAPGPPPAPAPTPPRLPQELPFRRRALTPSDQMPKDRPGIYQFVGGKYVELEATIGEIQTHGAFMSQKVEFVLGGTKAGYRVAERQPIFFSSYTSAEAPLVHLKPGRNDRNLKIGSSVCMPYAGCNVRRGVRAEDKIDVQSERDQSGYYQLTPRQPLPPGEYGFVLTQEIAGAASGKIWDFGVD